MNDTKEFKISALTKWKVEGKDEQIINISQTELIKQNFLKLGIPDSSIQRARLFIIDKTKKC